VTYNGREYRFAGCDQVGPDHVVSEMRRWGKWYSLESLERLRRIGLKGTWVDVGANIGTFTVYFLNECGAEHVYAVECNPGTFAALQKNVERNTDPRRVTLVNAAAFSAPGRVGLGFRIADNNATCCVSQDLSGGSVPAVLLDEVLKDAVNITMLKLDVEEFEVDALMGARRTLREHRPLVYMECLEPFMQRMNEFMSEVRYELIKPMGRCYLWGPAGWKKPAAAPS
jgi:FkbM family methyltransferase